MYDDDSGDDGPNEKLMLSMKELKVINKAINSSTGGVLGSFTFV